MRFTQVLCRQHIGFYFKKHWVTQGQRKLLDNGAEAQCLARGMQVVDPKEILKENRHSFKRFEIVGPHPPVDIFNETHPLWHSKPCFLYGDSNVLLEGVKQAQVLLNTVVFNAFPSSVEEKLANAQIPVSVDKSMQQSVLAACVFDPEQVKTAVIPAPGRPAYKLPRNYGISEARKNRLLISKFLTNSERLAERRVNSSRKILSNAMFVVPITKGHDDLIQFEIHADTFLASSERIKPVDSATYVSQDIELPVLFPLSETVTIPMQNFYEERNLYPIQQSNKFSNPHTIFIHFSPEDVRNMHETPVTEEQFESRSMVKAFTVAAAKARQQYGDDVKDLPSPITVQAIQTNGKSFHFSIFQLNTLNFNAAPNSLKNLWFSKPKLDLYAECGYIHGKPTLNGYNKNVLKHFHIFYNN